MYERSYGSNYDGSLSSKEIAAKVRKQLRAESKKAGSALDGWKVSVRYRSYSGGSSIDVDLFAPAGVSVKADDQGYEDGYGEMVNRSAGHRWPWLNDAGRAAQQYGESALWQYNHDGSEIMVDYFDVNFYGHASVYEEGDYRWKN